MDYLCGPGCLDCARCGARVATRGTAIPYASAALKWQHGMLWDWPLKDGNGALGDIMKLFFVRAVILGLALAAAVQAPTAQACGGFFCSSTPVDQNAERVVFKVRGDGRTDMIVQITYQGKAEDFAWLLPLAEPPKESDLGIFPQRALTALDAHTGVVVSGGCVRAHEREGVVLSP